MNDIFLKGYIGQEPETKTGRNDTEFLVFTLGVYQGKNMPTAWYSVTYFQKPNTTLTLHKSDRVWVKGRLSIKTWNNAQEGKTMRAIEIIADDVDVVDLTRLQKNDAPAPSYKEASRQRTQREMNEPLIDDLPENF